MSKNPMNQETYQGRFFGKVETEASLRKKYYHPIFIYSPTEAEGKDGKRLFKRLSQVVNVYEHTIPDFVCNARKIIEHYKKSYGDSTFGLFTLGQSIQFRVVPGQEPFNLSLFAFFINYAMLVLPITLKADLTNWTPYVPQHWSGGSCIKRIDEYIEMCRPLGNMRAIGECLEYFKFMMNLWASEVGDRLALSLDNNMIIELMNRSPFVRETITCDYEIPHDTSPQELEIMSKDRTSELLNFTCKQRDLPISVYARNGLFNPIQAREFFVHLAHKPNLFGNTIPYTHHTNIIMGTADPRAHMVDAYGGCKAETLKLNVSDAGAMERSLSMMCSPMRFVDVDWECDSQHFRIRHIDSVDVLDKLDGRVATLSPESEEYFIIDPKNTSLVGKTIYMKTPITCTHPKRSEGYICSACYGKLMSNLNRDVHIGRLAALESSDDIEQLLLSAKHALDTHTARVEFNDAFDQYFESDRCMIYLNDDMIEASMDPNSDFNYLWLEFYPSTMTKHKDGEGRPHDRGMHEIVIYNEKTDTRTIIKDENNLELYLSTDFVKNFFLPAYRFVDEKNGVVQIPFSDLIDTGKPCCDEIFEYQYYNQELAEAILTLTHIMDKGSRINAFSDYNECLDTLIPLFAKGGIHIPELQCEMLVSMMIYGKDGHPVDWNEPDPEYQFYSIDKSIQHINSALTSILYQDTGKQLEGSYNTYAKNGTSAYDWFIFQRGFGGAATLGTPHIEVQTSEDIADESEE